MDHTDPAGTSRADALHTTGLSAAPDPSMQRFARLVTKVLGVPVALVSLVEADRQVFPGLAGPDGLWAGGRTTPLTRALCRRVVSTGRPLVLPRTDADPDLAAYAGTPLTDVDGHVLGALCAVDTAPRDWTSAQLDDLVDLAAACSAELRLRVTSRRAGELTERTRDSLTRSELLLRAAEDLGDTAGLSQVRRQIRDLVTSDLKPSYIGLVLIEDGGLRRLSDLDEDFAVERTHERYGLDDPWPTARAARDNTTIVLQGARALSRGGYGEDAIAAWTDLGLRTAICVPLPGTRSPLGTLVIGWNTPHEIDVLERAVVTAVAGYTARAVERALYLDNRVGVARELQEAMLTDLPEVDGLEIAALYRPAAVADLVGGDWYDAYLLAADPSTVAMTIGDITGHDMHAATLMGQVRSMLRQADFDHPGADPAEVIAAFEHANRALGLNASGSLIHAHLRPAPPGWELRWSCAGHLPPLLHGPGDVLTALEEGDIMLHPGLVRKRTTHRTAVPPGATLLLYTDGLVERRGRDLDRGIADITPVLTGQAGRPLPELLHTIADEVAGVGHEDDIALIAVRVPERPPE